MTKFIVGAYASQPADHEGQRKYYERLHASGWVDGLEVPFPGQWETVFGFLGEMLAGRFTHSVLTPIPGTMVTMWKNPSFGLASSDKDGRSRALDYLSSIRENLEKMTAQHGHIFDYVELHSAPNTDCQAEYFAQSITEISSWDWSGAQLTIEHCDEKTTEHTPEKGFLHLEDELAIAKKTGVAVSLNWGRSAVGSRGDQAPNEHIKQAAASGLLAGVIFSGASPQETIYGPEWIDGHLPLSTDEPASLMTPQQVSEGARLAGDVAYLGAKCCVPKDASIERRYEMIHAIYQAAMEK